MKRAMSKPYSHKRMIIGEFHLTIKNNTPSSPPLGD